MTRAWQPFKASLGEGFEQIYTVMQGVADKINSTVIPAVNNLVSALGSVARELASVAQAGNLDIKVKAVSQPTDIISAGKKMLASGGGGMNMAPSYNILKAEKKSMKFERPILFSVSSHEFGLENIRRHKIQSPAVEDGEHSECCFLRRG